MSDLQSKKEFVDSIQKTMSYSCMKLCFEQTHVQQACVDRCFDKFTAAVQTVSHQMLQSGRDVGSEYPKRLRQEISMFTDLIYGEQVITYKFADPGEAQVFDKATNKGR